MSKTNLNWLGIICLVTTLTSANAADDTRLIRWGGSARTRFEYDYFTNYSNIRQMTWLRFRPYFSVEPEQGFSVYFEPQFAKAMGENTVSANSTTGTADQNSGGTNDASLGVHQAYMNYSESPAFEIRVGRQVLSYGDELSIGALEWNNVARTFDAVRLRSDSETRRFDFFWSKLIDTNVAGSGTGDYDFLGSYSTFKKIAGIDETDLYALYLLDARGTGPDPLQLWSFGFRLKSKSESFDYRMEAIQQAGHVSGSSAAARGTQGDAELGYRLSGERPLRVGVEAFYADSDYNQLFPTAHKWLGFADIFSRRNITGLALHSSIPMSDRWKLMADLHRFYKANKGDPAYKLSGAAIAGSNTGDSYLGTELDVTTQYDISARTSLQGGLGLFAASETLRGIQSRNPFF